VPVSGLRPLSLSQRIYINIYLEIAEREKERESLMCKGRRRRRRRGDECIYIDLEALSGYAHCSSLSLYIVDDVANEREILLGERGGGGSIHSRR